MPRKDLAPDVDLPSPWNTGAPGFVGVWDINDNGDVPPRGIIQGPGSYLVHPAGVAIDPKTGEVFVTDGVRKWPVYFSGPRFFLQRNKKWPGVVPDRDKSSR